MFEKIRHSLDELLARATRPEDRRAVVTQMKDALVHARVALDDLRGGVRQTQRRLEAERRELDTIARRKGLAQRVNDAETVTIAERFERQHAEKVMVLEAKLQAQDAELALAEREVEAMGVELRRAMSGAVGAAPGAAPGAARVGADAADDPLAGAADEFPGGERGAGASGATGAAGDDPLADENPDLASEINAAARAGRRARLEQEADARLAELKRRMGK
jgi:hypothetical protein